VAGEDKDMMHKEEAEVEAGEENEEVQTTVEGTTVVKEVAVCKVVEEEVLEGLTSTPVTVKQEQEPGQRRGRGRGGRRAGGGAGAAAAGADGALMMRKAAAMGSASPQQQRGRSFGADITHHVNNVSSPSSTSPVVNKAQHSPAGSMTSTTAAPTKRAGQMRA
jgi:hypothetical protein